jgi:hypothetical protein
VIDFIKLQMGVSWQTLFNLIVNPVREPEIKTFSS